MADNSGGVPPATPVLELRRDLTQLINESKALRTDVKGAEHARRRATSVSLALLSLLVLFVGMLLVIGYQNNQLVHKVDEANARMADCTTPGGTCYSQGAVRTHQAIVDVIRAELLMAECARLYPGEVGPTYDAKLEKCVYSRLADTQSAAPDRHLMSPSPSPRKAASPSAKP